MAAADGEEKLEALFQKSLFVAVRLGAAWPADFIQVITDTTVQQTLPHIFIHIEVSSGPTTRTRE